MGCMQGMDMLKIYADDLLLMRPPEPCKNVTSQLKSAFTLTSAGEVKFLLGNEITIDRTQNNIV
ncbi:hypothetical protein GN244_ATG02828 [Phytophthora infestans]|uniref:Reverse transcriptase domain-containing protein n=1 Tax=Phytophthora infestans TaxID=4787 RepID=A0A833SRR8_PHYIN|nr:hypothetical protein GN244_ATG02828 [Phytophthora infestans]